MTKMKPSEFGGSDTDKTLGIQPAPHRMSADEQLRVNYSYDPAVEEALPIPSLLADE